MVGSGNTLHHSLRCTIRDYANLPLTLSHRIHAPAASVLGIPTATHTANHLTS